MVHKRSHTKRSHTKRSHTKRSHTKRSRSRKSADCGRKLKVKSFMRAGKRVKSHCRSQKRRSRRM